MNDSDESVYFLVNLVVLVSLGILVNLSFSDDSGESAFSDLSGELGVSDESGGTRPFKMFAIPSLEQPCSSNNAAVKKIIHNSQAARPACSVIVSPHEGGGALRRAKSFSRPRSTSPNPAALRWLFIIAF